MRPASIGSTTTVAPSRPPSRGSVRGSGSARTFMEPAYARGLMADAPGSRIFAPGLLEGQVCVVSGAGTGMGRATAIELADLGAVVVGCARREEPLAGTAEAIGEREGSFEHEQLDIREAEAVDAFIGGVVERHGRIDLLVNNAGGQFMSPAEAITPKGFRTVMDLNVQGTWQMTHAAATKAFIPQESGKVVSVTLSPHHGCRGWCTRARHALRLRT